MNLGGRGPYWALCFAMAGLLSPLFAAPAFAQEKNDYNDEWHNFLGVIGLGSDRAPIDYTQRPLIAVPPSYNLPAPGTAAVQRPAGFPNDPDVDARRKAMLDARRPILPGSESGPGRARNYLIEPPTEYLDAAKVAATGNDRAGGPGDDVKPAHKGHRQKPQPPAAAAAPAPAATQ